MLCNAFGRPPRDGKKLTGIFVFLNVFPSSVVFFPCVRFCAIAGEMEAQLQSVNGQKKDASAITLVNRSLTTNQFISQQERKKKRTTIYLRSKIHGRPMCVRSD